MYIIKVDVQKCQGDGDCVDTCPSTIFKLEEVAGKKIAIVSGNPDDCLGCESCVSICPGSAITITES